MYDPIPQIHTFSTGYYLIEGMYVEPDDDVDVPQVHDQIYAHIQEEYYEARPTPILLRHNTANYHFQIHPDDGVRVDTIAMPFELVADMNLDRFPDEEQFLLAKPEHSHALYRLSDPNTTTIEG